MNFVDLVMSGKEDISRLPEYMDEWDMNSGIPIWKFLGFKESEWLIIVQEILAYKFIMQEIAVKRNVVSIDQKGYEKLLNLITPSASTLMSGHAKKYMEGKLQALYEIGFISFVPSHLYVSYKGYAGFNSNKFYMDLVDISNIKFDWSKLENEDENKDLTASDDNVGTNGNVERTEESVPKDRSEELFSTAMDPGGPVSAGERQESVQSVLPEIPVSESVPEEGTV